jgi:menaquinone-dependent protoporphyrinogen IX oxidase
MEEKRKILVTYSSGYGATREVGEEIARVVRREKPLDVDLVSIDKVESVELYHSVIIGTSIRADTILANTKDFFAANKEILSERNVAFFMVCLTASTEEGKLQVMQDYLPQITDSFPLVKLISTNAFGGKIDYGKMNPVMQNLAKRVVEEKTGEPSNGSFDARNWQHIKDWAIDLARLL